MSTVEAAMDTTSVNMEFSDVKLAEDEDGTRTMFIQALALDEGVWNGIYFNAEDIQEKISTLNGRRVLVSHQFESPDDVKGWVEGISNDGVASLRVFDEDTIVRVQDGELNSVSVGVQIQQTNGMATILDFNEISLTGNPACKTCTIQEYEVAMLEKNSEQEKVEMTEEEIVEDNAEQTDVEELCACDEPALEEPVVEEEASELDEEIVEEETLEETVALEAALAELEELKASAAKNTAYIAELETQRKHAEVSSRVEILLDEARFKPAHSEELINFLMSLSDSQMEQWNTVEQGLGAVVPLEDLAETGEFSPVDENTAALTADKMAFRSAMGFKE